jgi:hypothetical protein
MQESIDGGAAPAAAGVGCNPRIFEGITRVVPRARVPAAAGCLPAGTRLHEYEILGVLGRGGFGLTYLARDVHLDKRVAIKEYLPGEFACRSGTQVTVRSANDSEAFRHGLRQFVREARTLARFSHPSLVPVYRFFETNGTAYFVMAYVEGETLCQRLKSEPAIDEEGLRAVLLPVMAALETVHAAGVLHRDIKPANIILRGDGTPALIDFGAARLNFGTATRSAICVLTAGYAPLEQYGADMEQGPWTDVYALAAVAYRAITGGKPPDAVDRISGDPIVPAAVAGWGRFSRAFLAAVDRGLAVHAQDRPRSIADLRRALAGEGTASRPPAQAAPIGMRQILRHWTAQLRLGVA